jgi:ribonuclease Z
MITEITQMTELAYEGSITPLTTTPIVGTTVRGYAPTVVPEAEQVVNGVHTSPAAAGGVFARAAARMSVMWHLAVDRDTVGPVFSEMSVKYDGPVTIAQDRTTFTITKDVVVARQWIIDPFAWPVVGPTTIAGPPMNHPSPPPAWWADALITD